MAQVSKSLNINNNTKLSPRKLEEFAMKANLRQTGFSGFSQAATFLFLQPSTLLGEGGRCDRPILEIQIQIGKRENSTLGTSRLV